VQQSRHSLFDPLGLCVRCFDYFFNKIRNEAVAVFTLWQLFVKMAAMTMNPVADNFMMYDTIPELRSKTYR